MKDVLTLYRFVSCTQEDSDNHYPRLSYTLPNTVMDDLFEFVKLLKEIMSSDSRYLLSSEEIYFDCPVTDVIELAGDHLVVWLN